MVLGVILGHHLAEQFQFGLFYLHKLFPPLLLEEIRVQLVGRVRLGVDLYSEANTCLHDVDVLERQSHKVTVLVDVKNHLLQGSGQFKHLQVVQENLEIAVGLIAQIVVYYSEQMLFGIQNLSLPLQVEVALQDWDELIEVVLRLGNVVRKTEIFKLFIIWWIFGADWHQESQLRLLFLLFLFLGIVNIGLSVEFAHDTAQNKDVPDSSLIFSHFGHQVETGTDDDFAFEGVSFGLVK